MRGIRKDMGQGDQPAGQAVESDPKKLQERHSDAQNSFLDVYRSLDSARVALDEELVSKCVAEGVVPVNIRYGVMRGVNRGVAKSTSGELFYFNHVPDSTFKLVPVSVGANEKVIATREWEANKLLGKCNLGCDMRKADEIPSEDSEKLDKAPQAGTIPEDEEQAILAQQRMLQERHYGGAGGGTTPDKPEVGRNWHEPIRRGQEETFQTPGDGMNPVATNDGEKHWTAGQLIKAFGEQLQQTAPRVRPQLTPLEVRFATEVLGKSQEVVNTGQVMFSPWEQQRFQQWKTQNLRSRLVSPLQKWLGKE
jgi:hypothetical protein